MKRKNKSKFKEKDEIMKNLILNLTNLPWTLLDRSMEIKHVIRNCILGATSLTLSTERNAKSCNQHKFFQNLHVQNLIFKI